MDADSLGVIPGRAGAAALLTRYSIVGPGRYNRGERASRPPGGRSPPTPARPRKGGGGRKGLSSRKIGRIPTPRPLSRDEVRAIDRRAAEELGLPTLVLMENAGRVAAALVRERRGSQPPARVRDPVRAGQQRRRRRGRGPPPGRLGLRASRVLWLADPARLAPDAAVQSHDPSPVRHRPADPAGAFAADALGAWLADAAAVVDGLLGTGLTRPVEGPWPRRSRRSTPRTAPCWRSTCPRASTPTRAGPLGVAVRATRTATFVAPKLGFAAPGAAAYTGVVHVVEIGVPRCLLPG